MTDVIAADDEDELPTLPPAAAPATPAANDTQAIVIPATDAAKGDAPAALDAPTTATQEDAQDALPPPKQTPRPWLPTRAQNRPFLKHSPRRFADLALQSQIRGVSGDGGNRTRVRGRVRMASTSVAGSLISSCARLAGRVVQDQPPGWSPDRRRRAFPGEPAI